MLRFLAAWLVCACACLPCARAQSRPGPLREAALLDSEPGEASDLASNVREGLREMGRESGWYANVKRISMPYGMRLPVSYLWYRDVTRGQRERRTRTTLLPCTPLSVRYHPLLGDDEEKIAYDPFRERGYAGYAEYAVRQDLSVGMTASLLLAYADRVSLEQLKTWRRTQTAFVRKRLNRTVTLWGELKLEQLSRESQSVGGVAQIEFEPIHGVHLACSGEFAQRMDQELLAGGWLTVDWLFNKHFEARFDAAARTDSGAQLLARFNTYF